VVVAGPGEQWPGAHRTSVPAPRACGRVDPPPALLEREPGLGQQPEPLVVPERGRPEPRPPRHLTDRHHALRWLDAAKWAELEAKCCPFFSFELNAVADRGPVWLEVTGRTGAKAFMKEEFGL
jgi:hypothetical protein